MLDFTKNISCQGTSKINGEVAATYNAQVNSVTGAGNISTCIVNAELYNANRKTCRKDFADYTNKVYEIEDELLTENQETQN